MVHLRTLVLKKIINVNLSLLTVPLISDWEFKMLLLKFSLQAFFKKKKTKNRCVNFGKWFSPAFDGIMKKDVYLG